MSKAPSCDFNKGKGKGKENLKYVRSDMNNTWKKMEDCNTSNREGITSPSGSSNHTSSN